MVIEFVGGVKAHEVWVRKWEVLTEVTKRRGGDIWAGGSRGTTGADVSNAMMLPEIPQTPPVLLTPPILNRGGTTTSSSS